MIVVTQLSLEAIKASVPSCSSRVGLNNGLGTPNRVSSGPMARIITLFRLAPLDDEPSDHHIVASLNKGARVDIT